MFRLFQTAETDPIGYSVEAYTCESGNLIKTEQEEDSANIYQSSCRESMPPKVPITASAFQSMLVGGAHLEGEPEHPYEYDDLHTEGHCPILVFTDAARHSMLASTVANHFTT